VKADQADEEEDKVALPPGLLAVLLDSGRFGTLVRLKTGLRLPAFGSVMPPLS